MIKLHIIIISMILSLMAGALSANTIENDIAFLQKQWAVINFQVKKSDREKRFFELTKKAKKVINNYPNRAEPLVWSGIIFSSYAGAKGGLGALSLIEKAKQDLLSAEKINATVLKGSIYTSLGVLYYKAPGWPISFGDNTTARRYLERALAINPNGIDANYFYGDFLIEQGEYKKAISVLSHALNAPTRVSRKIADFGRKKEIRAKLFIARKKIN